MKQENISSDLNSPGGKVQFVNSEVKIPKELQQLVPGFVGRRVQEVYQLEELMKENRLDAVAEIAHRMKGNGVAYGFEVISLLGKMIENSARASDKERTQTLINNLHSVMDEIERLYGESTQAKSA